MHVKLGHDEASSSIPRMIRVLPALLLLLASVAGFGCGSRPATDEGAAGVSVDGAPETSVTGERSRSQPVETVVKRGTVITVCPAPSRIGELVGMTLELAPPKALVKGELLVCKFPDRLVEGQSVLISVVDREAFEASVRALPDGVGRSDGRERAERSANSNCVEKHDSCTDNDASLRFDRFVSSGSNAYASADLNFISVGTGAWIGLAEGHASTDEVLCTAHIFFSRPGDPPAEVFEKAPDVALELVKSACGLN